MAEMKDSATRRDFLKLTGAAAPAVVAAVAAGTPAAAIPAEETVGSGLSNSAHVQKYLELARF